MTDDLLKRAEVIINEEDAYTYCELIADEDPKNPQCYDLKLKAHTINVTLLTQELYDKIKELEKELEKATVPDTADISRTIKTSETTGKASREEVRAAVKAVKAQDDGWIPHDGGKQPVDDDVMVEVKFKDGMSDEYRANEYTWNWIDNDEKGDNLVAYRVIRPKTEKKETLSEQCSSCIYYAPLQAFRNNPDEKVGRCRKNPPKVFSKNIHEGMFNGINRVYPTVNFCDWCGEHFLKQECLKEQNNDT